MCCMTETGFRWQPTMAVPLTTSKWYVYARATGEHRYSQQFQPEFKPLYAIRIKANTQGATGHA
jgi:hypothetical protein